MKAAATPVDLTFSTPNDSGFPFVLFLCVLGSLLAHAATFFLFQVVYPQRVTIPQPPPQVSLLTPSSPENIALLRWIDAEDPALIANDNPVTPPGLADVQYRPSFASPRTAPLGPPAEPTHRVRFPVAAEKLSESVSGSAISQPVAPRAADQTSITYSGPLKERATTQPHFAFAYHTAAPVEPTTVLLGVSDTGKVRFSVLQQSSGDSQLDELAVTSLNGISFAPSTAPITWGYATIAWGADAYTKKATKESAP